MSAETAQIPVWNWVGEKDDRLENLESLLLTPEFLVEIWEEGEDDARSACPSDILGYTHNIMAGTTRRNRVTWSKPLEKQPKFGLRSATRPHEAGIASNRGSAIPR